MSGTILFDAHNLLKSNATGIGTYARALVTTTRRLGYRPQLLMSGNAPFDAKDPQVSEILLFDALLEDRQPPRVRRERWLAQYFGKPLGIRPTAYSNAGAVHHGSANPLAQFDKIHVAPNVFDLATSHFRRHRQRATLKLGKAPSLLHMTHPTPLKAPGCPNIYTIHDIVPLRLPHATLDDKHHVARLLRHLCANADHIVTVSEFSRRDIIDFFGIAEDRITNAYQSVHLPENLIAKDEHQVANEISRAFNVSMREYYLFVGAIEPKKNVGRMVDAYAASGSPYPLLIAGGLGWQFESEVEKIDDERFLSYVMKDGRISADRRVRRIPYLPLSQLISLIRGARGVLFPSLYEGFGLPVLEAMLLGTPVITSNVSSLPEIAGGAACLVDPTDVDDIVRAIRSFDADADLRAELSARGVSRAAHFSPQAYEQRIAALYKRLGVASPATGSGEPEVGGAAV
jgi:glycosyltransferase involved in cell wall biosynthesis